MARSGPYPIKQGDTATPIRATLFDADGIPVPLPPGTPVSFAMRPAVSGMGVAAWKKDARIVSDPGKVAYDLVDADVQVPGPYKAEFEVILPGGPQTFPSDGYLDVVILDDVA